MDDLLRRGLKTADNKLLTVAVRKGVNRKAAS